MRKVISNTTLLIALADIGCLDLLQSMVCFDRLF